MKYKWLLFDADGTLFNYDKAETEALKATFEGLRHPFAPDFAEIYTQINRRIWLEFERGEISQTLLRTKRFEILFETVGVRENSEIFSDKYLRHLAARSDLIDGAEAVIKALYSKFQLFIITNGLKDVQRPRLANSALAGYFVDMVVSDAVGAAKPDAKIFDIAFERMDQPDNLEPLVQLTYKGDTHRNTAVVKQSRKDGPHAELSRLKAEYKKAVIVYEKMAVWLRARYQTI
jgi:2-haloacid dehalogenase